MDTWFYYDVIHGLHTYCNPVSHQTILELSEILDLSPQSRVLDIACGLGELLVGFAERHGASGVGIDASPQAIDRARRRMAQRVPTARLEFLVVRGEEYRPDPPEQFDVVSLIGASWIWGGLEGTLRAMIELAQPGGLLVLGEPYWQADPPEAYLALDGLGREEFTTLAGCQETARALGLDTLWMRGSSAQDWDRYEMLQLASIDRFAGDHPEHPDLEAIRRRREPSTEAYLRWGRDCLGFALWVLRTPGASGAVAGGCPA